MRNLILIAATIICSVPSHAQPMEQLLIAQGFLDSANVKELAVFDTIVCCLDLRSALVDTTVILSDSVLYSIIMFGDNNGVNALYYLMSFDRVQSRPIDVVYLHDAPDIDQSLRRFDWVEHSIWASGEVGTIEYDCRVARPGTLHERTSMQASGRRFWRVEIDGLITGGELIKEDR